ncbi:uncharacterized protein MAM_05453 [Metarhizium album ARSEF 1941]|uniref:Uncharacterized protein n=1 Tax=Metarhizium album (strain ARSEF 1941) TaxID=1081103 RepID=A0A0B2WUB8_METAS|nr:uncharacterized protein MAM_05453 [Metarhizium album ARSEF 1941]KHN96510.1 hypothetical protein MAM_05453 [Metarhizium album ARSEF 1941]
MRLAQHNTHSAVPGQVYASFKVPQRITFTLSKDLYAAITILAENLPNKLMLGKSTQLFAAVDLARHNGN